MTNHHKNKYKGEFNINGMVFTLYTWASHEDKAFKNFLFKLSKKYNMNIHLLRSLFNNTKDNYRITEVKND